MCKKNSYIGIKSYLCVKKQRYMTRKEFAELLNSIKVPEGCDSRTLNQNVLPISQALVEMMPEKLFRYRNCSDMSIEAFENDKVYAVTADMFNDPYDTLLRFDKEIVRQMFVSILSKDVFRAFKKSILKGMDFPDIVKQNFSEDYIANVKEFVLSLTTEEDIDNIISSRKEYIANLVDIFFPMLVNYVNKISTTISCFSETIESVTMWSHYANYHKGFVLEYNLRETLSNNIPNVGIFPVIYDDKRYDATPYATWEFLKFLGINIPNTDMISHIKCALYKSCQWEYEKEWRMIDSTIRNNIIKEDKTCVSLKPKAIYYGTNISANDKKRLHDIAQSKGIKEYEMYIDYASEKYEMLFRESTKF